MGMMVEGRGGAAPTGDSSNVWIALSVCACMRACVRVCALYVKFRTFAPESTSSQLVRRRQLALTCQTGVANIPPTLYCPKEFMSLDELPVIF